MPSKPITTLSGRTVTRAFRLYEELNEALEEEAERQGISVNALHNQIIRAYAMGRRYEEQYETMVIPRRTMLSILELRDANKAGELTGTLLPKNWLTMAGFPLDLNSVLYFTEEIMGRYREWFKCDHHIVKNEHVLHLRHDVGREWNIFLGSYMKAMFKSVLDLDANIDFLDNAVTVTVQIPK